MTETTQRIDKWLWYTRFFKTRSLAAKFVTSGKVRLTSGDATSRVTKASQTVKVDDVLTFAKGDHVRVIKVVHTGTRRGPAPEAQELYEDLAPPQPKPKKEKALGPATREPGSGRPTKKQRRQMDKWLDESG